MRHLRSLNIIVTLVLCIVQKLLMKNMKFPPDLNMHITQTVYKYFTTNFYLFLCLQELQSKEGTAGEGLCTGKTVWTLAEYILSRTFIELIESCTCCIADHLFNLKLTAV